MEGVIVAVAHDEFKKSPFLAQVLSLERKCIDVRGIFKEEDARQKGFYYRRL
jgi:UDP-N-acetyl-D-mannosaminuronate dehydrogenase